jgi:hypothetical protein
LKIRVNCKYANKKKTYKIIGHITYIIIYNNSPYTTEVTARKTPRRQYRSGGITIV